MNSPKKAPQPMFRTNVNSSGLCLKKGKYFDRLKENFLVEKKGEIFRFHFEIVEYVGG